MITGFTVRGTRFHIYTFRNDKICLRLRAESGRKKAINNTKSVVLYLYIEMHTKMESKDDKAQCEAGFNKNTFD